MASQYLVNRERVWTDLQEARDTAADLEDSNDSEAASEGGSDCGPEVQQLPDQVWEYPLTRKEQHLRLEKMQDMGRLHAEAEVLRIKIQKQQDDRAHILDKKKLAVCEEALKAHKQKAAHSGEESKQSRQMIGQFVMMLDQALATNPNVTQETRDAWAEIRKMRCAGGKTKGTRLDRSLHATKTDRASSSTASTRASTSDDAHPELDDIEDQEEEAEMDDKEQALLFKYRATALLQTLDRQERLAAAAPAAAAAGAAEAAAGPPAAAQQQEPVLAIMEYPTIWSRTKGVLVDLFQPFETE